MEEIIISPDTQSDAATYGDPEWRYVPVRRTSFDGAEGGGDIAMEDLVLQSEGTGWAEAYLEPADEPGLSDSFDFL